MVNLSIDKTGARGTGFYFIQQAAKLVPICRILPESTADVAGALALCREVGVPFAVKSGGMGTYAEAANIENGVTIDLVRFKDVTISEDRKTVVVGAGCRWGEVYSKLDKAGLSIIGGRVASVGVGGLTLGGRCISFFSSRKGLACDNIRSYEMVLASGKVIKVTRTSYPDLYWAMRGQMWGGEIQYSGEQEHAVLAALDKYNRTGTDEYAEAYVFSIYVGQLGGYVETAVLSYSKPENDPPDFKEFRALPLINSSTRLLSLSELASDLDIVNQPGLRCKTTSQTIKSDLATMKEVSRIFKEVIEHCKDLPGFIPTLLYQPLRPAMLPKDDVGNVLGIVPENGALVVIALLWCWENAEHDKTILDAAASFMQRVEAAATDRGTFHRYIYLNYAAPEQDIYGSYGKENRKRLLDISGKYDPEQIFSKLRPGYLSRQA
ncbi:hypothetical protein F5884DRAFT_883984 [Xylogone sp. PMI_703]|nr:hypothetical protein F5884DRAFT_883984 [Xylogone sp. PMI_703]